MASCVGSSRERGGGGRREEAGAAPSERGGRRHRPRARSPVQPAVAAGGQAQAARAWTRRRDRRSRARSRDRQTWRAKARSQTRRGALSRGRPPAGGRRHRRGGPGRGVPSARSRAPRTGPRSAASPGAWAKGEDAHDTRRRPRFPRAGSSGWCRTAWEPPRCRRCRRARAVHRGSASVFGVLLYLLYREGAVAVRLAMAAGEDADAREGSARGSVRRRRKDTLAKQVENLL